MVWGEGRAEKIADGAYQKKVGQAALATPIGPVQLDSTVGYPDASPVNGTRALRHPVLSKTSRRDSKPVYLRGD